ncbi:MAG: undecaprenyl-phosphate galactose phosphotransferase WbaP [Thermodesulfovibrionales bacterium]|nr:undecaprenyl-phosphate galactose phosphotransferase WbaP [Thermodesulfovibrionales bacterium]
MNKTIYTLILIFADVLGFYISFCLAYLTRSALNYSFLNFPLFDITSALFILKQVWIPIILIALLGYAGLYTKRQNFWIDTKQIVKSTFLCLMIVLAIITLSKMTDEVSRLFVLLIFLYSLFLIPTLRAFTKKLLHKKGIGIEHVIVVSDIENAKRMCQLIEDDKYIGYAVGCVFSDVVGSIKIMNRDIKVYKSIKWLKRIAKLIGATTAFISLKNDKCINGNVSQIQMAIKNVYVMPDIDFISHLNTEIASLFKDDSPVLHIKNNLKDPVNTLIKMTFDYTVSLLIMPIFIVMVCFVALLIKIDSKGPVFFRQKRVGRFGQEFYVYKFRTMYVDAEERLKEFLNKNPSAKTEFEEYYKLKDDPRITKVGKILRITSLDELPQVLNVLKGEMSLIGPRPLLKEELEQYYGHLAEFYKEVKPGITGLWQVSGRNKLTMKERARLDSFYVINWSLWLDIVILLKTFKVVFLKEGAY